MVLTHSDRTSCGADAHSITVTNIKSGDALCYPLCLLKGHVSMRNQPSACRWPEAKLQMRQYSSHDKRPTVTNWPVVNCEFKSLAHLSTGNNHIILEYCGTTTEFMLTYHPRNTSFHVIPVYIICKNHDGQFQAPASEDNTVQSACQRITLGTRLIQCLMAEKLKEAGFERKTFQIEQDLNPSSPECHVFHSQLDVEQARKMKGIELWEYFGRELMMSSLGRQDRKFLAFLSCTRYNPKSIDKFPSTHDEMIACTEAYVALGGGGLALFGSACLHTWASRIEEVIPRLLNINKVDAQHFMDDSCYRGTYGGCYATTLGSVCHELGHTFDLGHSSEGIMARGFDNLDLVFALPPQNNNHLRGNSRNVISPVCKEEPQHSTVSLSKILNVSYSVASPMKRICSRPRRECVLQSSYDSSDSCSSHSSEVMQDDSELCRNDPGEACSAISEDHSVITNARRLSKSNGDCTFWTKSCATLLNHHRWFNSEKFANSSHDVLLFDPDRNSIISSCGICVAEVRDDSGLILLSYEFSDGVDSLPLSMELKPEGSCLIVVEDTVGNILKHSLV
ncbi:hypothetical protein R5R35_006342 [Gryllus longicercus]|uniref:Zinc metalloproteinase n=1 Tax=Gryllus longicercus TaxID=2509291 RepID=A0AAN9W4Q7_9ORTH